jgi:hypothetical protein
MKNLSQLFTGAALLLACLPSSLEGASMTRRGPDTIQYVVRNNVAPTEFGPETLSGTFEVQYTQRGDVVRERVVLQVAGLETNATVSLTAGIGDDPANVVTAAFLDTDSRGRVRKTFVSTQPPPRRASRLPAVPELMSPTINVGAICIEDSTGKLIANAGVQDAYRYQYVVRRNLTQENPEGTAEGSMTLTANQRKTKLTLQAGGLEPSTEYTLVMNGTAVGVVTSNDRGIIKIRDWPAEAPPVLTLRTLSLDGPDGPVLTSTFPLND